MQLPCKVAVFFLLLFFAAGTGKLWHYSKDGFSINRIVFDLSPENREAVPVPYDLLEGSFRYLGRGRQCYAFESLDGQTVLKIPRFDRYDLPFRWKMPFPFLDGWRRSLLEDRQKRLSFTLESFKIAEQELREETALLYAHFHESFDLPRRVALFDKLSRRFEIDLNRTAFILQEKKPLMMPQFLEALQKGDRKTAMLILDSFLKIIEKRARLGIFNKDPSFLKNFAWEKGRGIQIDIGSFYHKENLLGERQTYQLSLRESCQPLREWLGRLDADLLKCFDEHFLELLEKECVSLY